MMLAKLLVCFFLIQLSYADCVVNSTDVYRLPRSVSPTSYMISLSFNEFSSPYAYSGSVSIDIDILEPTSCIVIHSMDLAYNSIIPTVTIGSSIYQSESVTLNTDTQMAIYQFSNDLPTGFGVLNATFTGFVNTNNATGLFVSPLELFSLNQEKPDDIEEYLRTFPNWQDGPIMFATQFEGPYARTVFPCFDEPSFKATFQSTISVPQSSGLRALTNTAPISERNENGFAIYDFDQTPVPISSYLVAFAVGNFSFVSQVDNGIEYRVYTPPGKEAYGNFALNITIQLIDYWANLWDVPYPFTKLDQISVPRIVQDGMENIGLITYWPGFLLAVPEIWNTQHYQQNCMVISHELSHLWFGDTVTLPWWSETYNNEGFARYLQYTGCHQIFPSWNTWEDGSFSFFSFAYNIIKQDSLGTLRPEIVPPGDVSGTVSSVSNSFAGPTYPKGASLNRMFNVYMGDDTWNGALSYHLKKYKYTNPTTGDLLDSFDEYTNYTMDYKSKFMPWLTLSGFPIVTMDYKPEAGILKVTQKPCSRYLPNNIDQYLWFVSLPISPDGNLMSEEFIEFSTVETQIVLNTQSEFLQGNANHTSYFVVNYSTMDQWNSVIGTMISPSYDSVLRNLLVQDVFILTQMSHQPIDVALSMLSSFSQLTDESYWTSTLPLLFEITVALDEQEYYASLESEIVSLMQPIFNSISSSNTGLSTSLQSTILFYEVLYDNTNEVNDLISIYNNGNSFTEVQQKAGYFSVGRYGNENDYNSLYSLYPQVTDKTQGNDILLGLSVVQDLHLCNVTLTLFDDTFELSDRLSYARNMLAYNPYCRNLAWDYVRVTGYQLMNEQGASGSTAFLNSFAGLLSSETYLNEALTFLTDMKLKGWITSQQIFESLTLIGINIDIISTNVNWS